MSPQRPLSEPQRQSSPRDELTSGLPFVLLAIILGTIASQVFASSPSTGLWPARGILVSVLVVAITVASAVRRQTRPFLTLAPLSSSATEVRLAKWFLWMRSLACATATALILLTVDVTALLPQETFLPLLLCVGSLAAANISFGIALRKFPAQVNGQIWGQVISDLAILSLMLHYSGGIENPLSLLFLFHVIISGILFSKSRCYLVGLIAFSFFTALVLIELKEWAPHYTLQIFPHDHQDESSHAAHHDIYVYSRILLQALLLLTTAYFITTIMDRLRNRERESIELATKETEARERLESVVDAAGVGLRLSDSDLRPIWTNPRFLAWTTDESSVLENAGKTLTDGVSRQVEHEHLRPNGLKEFYRTTTAAMSRADGSPQQVVLLIQDITAQKRAESELLFAEKLAAVGELAGNISHEINNPLGVLSARLHLLISRHSDDLSEAVSKEVHRMTEMADRITTITRALLDYCRPNVSERKPVPIAPIVERSIGVMRAHRSNTDIKIATRVDSDLPLINVNGGELEQVLVNLLMNAVDESPAGTEVIVEVGAPPGISPPSIVRIVVQDSGPGVPEALRDRIFEPFFTTKKAGTGTGLGLSISRRIITNFGGTLALKNSNGSGARFQIDLPANTD